MVAGPVVGAGALVAVVTIVFGFASARRAARRSRRRKYFCACERICTVDLVITTRSMAFQSRPCLDKAETNLACSSSVQYCRLLVSTYFLRVRLIVVVALGGVVVVVVVVVVPEAVIVDEEVGLTLAPVPVPVEVG